MRYKDVWKISVDSAYWYKMSCQRICYTVHYTRHDRLVVCSVPRQSHSSHGVGCQLGTNSDHLVPVHLQSHILWKKKRTCVWEVQKKLANKFGCRSSLHEVMNWQFLVPVLFFLGQTLGFGLIFIGNHFGHLFLSYFFICMSFCFCCL